MYNDFKSYAALLIDIDFFKGKIINDDDGSVVMLDKILEATINIKFFEYCFGNDFSMINASTMENICKLKNLQQLEKFSLFGLPDIVNVKDISTFIKNRPAVKIYLSFTDEISEEYKIQLDALIDTVIKGEVAKHLIWYRGQNQEKYEIMSDRYFD
uniref:Uncharacterized protein n=1 Tax=Panagrolaimus sp. ES5 TaxID=591445 RepID=A0AC34FGE5_9BILA